MTPHEWERHQRHEARRAELEADIARLCDYHDQRHGKLPWWHLWDRLRRVFTPKFLD